MPNSKLHSIAGEYQLIPNDEQPCSVCNDAMGDKVMMLATLGEAGPARVCRQCLETGNLDRFLAYFVMDLMDRAKAISRLIGNTIKPSAEDWQQAAQQNGWIGPGWINNGEWVGNETERSSEH